jgi:hypothetical protein
MSVTEYGFAGSNSHWEAYQRIFNVINILTRGRLCRRSGICVKKDVGMQEKCPLFEANVDA